MKKVSLKYLYHGKERLEHGTGDLRKVKIVSTKPLVKNKSLILKAEAFGTKLYPVTIVLYGIDYSTKRDKAHPLTVQISENNYVYAAQPKLDEVNVSVRCNCMDFRMTWAHYDKEHGALSGRAFPAYQRKTTTRPPRNALKTPGLCKHLKTLVERLIHDKIIVT